VPIIRRDNYIYATLGTCYSLWITVRSTLHTRQSSIQNNKYKASHKYGCLTWWWAHSRPKHAEKRNKRPKIILHQAGFIYKIILPKYVDMMYLTAIGLPPCGNSTVHIYTQTIHRTTQPTQTIHRTQFTKMLKQYIYIYIYSVSKLKPLPVILNISVKYIHAHILMENVR
jgi:hypothetical protein